LQGGLKSVYSLEPKICLSGTALLRIGGKVKCRSKYLDQNPLEALAEMFMKREIVRHTYEKVV
jgi:hypothetical protein